MRENDLPLRNGLMLPNPLAAHAPAEANGMASEAQTPRQSQQQMSASASRPGTSAANRPSTRGTGDEQTTPAPNGSSSRPGLLRARSDFGPRHPSHQPPESTDDGASVDGHFKIRHGWDDQLNSEEYSNLLTSVRGSLPLLCHTQVLIDISRTSSCTLPTRNTRQAATPRARTVHSRSRNGACATG